jgi:hypothetical protein
MFLSSELYFTFSMWLSCTGKLFSNSLLHEYLQ